jgi:hypothetical protein
LPVAATLAAALMLVASAGAGTRPAITAKPIVSNHLGLAKYLASLGIDQKKLVLQSGTRNYAGPSCPGPGWNCTTAKVVFQYGPNNQFQCSPSNAFGGAPNPPDGCVVVQQSTTASNNASCVEKGTSPSEAQSCVIFQSSTTGTNTATVVQQVTVSGTTTQDVTQYSGINQASGDGANNATVTQTINGSISSPGAKSGGNEQQDGHQGSSLTQNASGAGNNAAVVSQSLALSAMTSGVKNINQNQNTDQTRGPNSNSDIEQTSGTGANSATLNQLNNLSAFAAGATSGSQTQGSSVGGEAGMFNQSTTGGVSTITGSQVEHQNLTTNPVPGSAVSQTQYGPLFYDPTQTGNTADTYNLSQSSDQHSNTPGSFQQDDEFAQCSSSGNCTVTENISQNGHSTSNSCGPMSSCDIGQSQTTTSEGTSSSSCGGPDSDGCEFEPPAPPLPPPFPCGPSCDGPGFVAAPRMP